MSCFQCSTDTLDLIAQAAYKYRIISKRERTLFGRNLWMTNQQGLVACYGETPATLADAETAYPEFTRLDRRFKRVAVSGALACFAYQAMESPTWEGSEVKRLLDIVAEKNANHAGHQAVTEVTEDEDGEEVSTVTQSAALAMRDAIGSDSPFWDITAAQRDPETEDFAGSVMVRPIQVIRDENEARETEILEARVAANAAANADVDDEDDDDYPEDGEDGDDW